MTSSVTLPAKPIPRLSDEEWKLVRQIILGPATKGGRPNINVRRSLEGMRWVASTGKPWVDMPEEFGSSATVRRQFARLKQRGVIGELLTTFPRDTPKSKAKLNARMSIGVQLACLQNLIERRARGRAATI